MNVQNEIEQLTISFFKTINSKITEDNGVYQITIPENYQIYFQKSQLLITFDEQIASEQDCELIIPGNKILYQIITNCTKKGPITLKQSKMTNGNLVIRYHFFVDFSGTHQSSQLFNIDVDLQTLELTEVTEQLEDGNFSLNEELTPETITKSYNTALEELKRKSDYMKTCFMDKVNSSFQNDLKLFSTRQDSEISELDDAINKKEETSDNFNEIQKFRFDTVEKIEKLEKEKSNLIDTLQEKHTVNLNYNLIACELISN